MVRLISRQRGGLAALKLTKLFGIDDFPAAKNSGKVLIIIYCYLIIIINIIILNKINNIKNLINKFLKQTKLQYVISSTFHTNLTSKNLIFFFIIIASLTPLTMRHLHFQHYIHLHYLHYIH